MSRTIKQLILGILFVFAVGSIVFTVQSAQAVVVSFSNKNIPIQSPSDASPCALGAE